MKTSWVIPISILVGGIIVAIAVYVSIPHQASTSSANSHPELVRPIGTSDHIFGNPAAKAMIIEYSDFNCEYCKQFHSTLHQIIANDGAKGTVAWVFREFPLTEIHPDALSYAKAAECIAKVAGNDAFWKFADALFDAQPADPTRYGDIAQSIGVKDTTAFATCFANASGAITDRIMKDRQNALDMGAVGTPFSIIVVPGRIPLVMDGAYSYDAAQALIAEALK